MTDDLAVHSRYLKQQMKMIWKLPWWFYMGEHMLTKMKKSEVLASAHYCGMRDVSKKAGYLLKIFIYYVFLGIPFYN